MWCVHDYIKHFLPIVLVPHSEDLSAIRPPAKDLDSESEGKHLEAESEEAYTGHTDEERSNYTFQISRNWMMGLEISGWQSLMQSF